MKFRSMLLLLISASAWAGEPVNQASLYRPETFQSLTADAHRRHVGDLLTVMVYESASALSSADTSASRNAGTDFNLQGTGKAWGIGAHANNQLQGSGRTQRENRVLAQITVTVKEVMSSGELLIAGEQLLEINDERQKISLEGTVRPQDVSESNVVQSNRVGNARIRFQGEGELSSRQRSGWWQRLLTLFGA